MDQDHTTRHLAIYGTFVAVFAGGGFTLIAVHDQAPAAFCFGVAAVFMWLLLASQWGWPPHRHAADLIRDKLPTHDRRLREVLTGLESRVQRGLPTAYDAGQRGADDQAALAAHYSNAAAALGRWNELLVHREECRTGFRVHLELAAVDLGVMTPPYLSDPIMNQFRATALDVARQGHHYVFQWSQITWEADKTITISPVFGSTETWLRIDYTDDELADREALDRRIKDLTDPIEQLADAVLTWDEVSGFNATEVEISEYSTEVQAALAVALSHETLPVLRHCPVCARQMEPIRRSLLAFLRHPLSRRVPDRQRAAS